MRTMQLRNSNRRESSRAAAFTKALVMNQLFRLSMFLAMVVALMTTGVHSQSILDAQRPDDGDFLH